MNSRYAAWAVGLAALIALPFVYRDPYHLHLLVLILIAAVVIIGNTAGGRRLLESETAKLTSGRVRIAGLGGIYPAAWWLLK